VEWEAEQAAQRHHSQKRNRRRMWKQLEIPGFQKVSREHASTLKLRRDLGEGAVCIFGRREGSAC